MCSNVKNNNQVYSYSQSPIPTPTYLHTSVLSPQKARYPIAANTTVQTIDLNSHNIHNWAILYSGATSHFLVTAAPTCHSKITKAPLKVRLPDGGHVTSTHTCTLDLPELPTKARLGHIILGLVSHSLLLVIKLCNAGCEVIFNKIGCIIKYGGKIVFTGDKCTKTGLWMVPISNKPTKLLQMLIPPPQEVLNHLELAGWAQETTANIHPTTAQPELAKYLHQHQIIFSLPKITLLKAINNHQLDSFPGLTYDLINKHLPQSTATEKGHMIRTRQGLRSTRADREGILDARKLVDNMNPTEQICTAVDNEMFYFAALADQNENPIYSDLAGRFPVRSYSGVNYIFIAYVYTINAIIIRPMKSRSDEHMVKTFQDIYTYLKTKNLSTKLHVLDNECSKAVKTYINSQQVKIQLVKPHNHRVNAAETAVKAAKYHLISALATVDSNCPLQLWDRFLPQVKLTLNLLRTSRKDKTKSAYFEMKGHFDFNKTPLAILGAKAVAYVDPTVRATWEPHALGGLVTGMCLIHYRLIEVYIEKTKSIRKCGTYRVSPTHCHNPTMAEEDKTIIATADLITQMNATIPKTATTPIAHAKILQQLTAIITNQPVPRAEAVPRVAAVPRVENRQPSTSTDPTNQQQIKATTFSHQRRTRNNTPIQITIEVESEVSAREQPPLRV